MKSGKIHEIIDNPDVKTSKVSYDPVSQPGSPSKKKETSEDNSKVEDAKKADSMKKKGKQKEEKKERERWKVLTDKFLNWWPVTIYMTVITIYALFADDFRLIFFEKEQDFYFYWMSSFSLFFFLLELFLASLAT